MPKALARSAMAWPMRPMPTSPSREPDILRASGIGPVGHWPWRTYWSACGMRRATLSISASARSATSSLSTSGVCATITPRALAAATSTPS